MAIGRVTMVTLGLLMVAIQLRPAQELADAPRPKEHRIPFQTRDGLIYVPSGVNGNHVTLLVDTGAVLTTFSLKIAPAPNTDSRITINMAKGSVSAFRVPVAFTVGDSDLKRQHCTFRQIVVVGDFKFGEADGVIGLDVLSRFKSATFDFKNSVLILEDK